MPSETQQLRNRRTEWVTLQCVYGGQRHPLSGQARGTSEVHVHHRLTQDPLRCLLRLLPAGAGRRRRHRQLLQALRQRRQPAVRVVVALLGKSEGHAPLLT